MVSLFVSQVLVMCTEYAALVVRVHHRSAPEVSPQPQRFHLATNHIIPLLSPSYSAYVPRQQANRRALLLFYPSLARVRIGIANVRGPLTGCGRRFRRPRYTGFLHLSLTVWSKDPS
ncbi:hypothetical protein BJ166DRAFT_269993 [Pestalotiopsis sp. NC0098]|nr:hypothetical protein BJ166DRAFT_269993 [Pestalotiopsis sp. NC0098]